MKIFTIVAGLPSSVREKLDRCEIDSVNKLFSKINLLDRPQRQIGSNNNTSYANTKGLQTKFNKNFCSGYQRRTQCPYCEKKGYAGRFHPESEYRTKAYDLPRNGNMPNNNHPSYVNAAKADRIPQNKTVKLVNNTELEELFSDEQNQKN